jgi:dolichyl-phosphate-mannose-protein mannosyltransferase
MASTPSNTPARAADGPCLLGLVRFYRLGEWSLWIDEALTVADAWHGEGLSNPLGYALVRWTAELFGGTDPFSLRLAAAVAGWLAIPLTWWAFRPLLGDWRAAATSLLLALGSWSVYWSQNVRFYTLAQVAGLLGTGLILRAYLGGRGGRALATAGLGLLGLGAGFHPSAALLGGALVGAALLSRPTGEARRIARWMGLLGLVLALGSSPWALGAFRRFAHVKHSSGLGSLLHLAKSTGFYLTPTVCAGLLVGAVFAWREGSTRARLVLLIPLLGCAGAGLAALFATGSAQYVFVLLPSLLALATWPLTGWTVGARYAGLLLLGAPLAAGTGLYFSQRHGERPRWREAYSYVADQRGPTDLILGMQAAVGEYYLAPGATDLRQPTRVAWCDRTNSHAWVRWAKAQRPLWIVLRPEFLQLWEPSARRDFERFLREQCKLVKRFPVNMEARDLDVEVWRR